MADKTPEQIREEAILARMTESRGALNRAQAELAVDAQIDEDAANEAAAATKAKAKK